MKKHLVPILVGVMLFLGGFVALKNEICTPIFASCGDGGSVAPIQELAPHYFVYSPTALAQTQAKNRAGQTKTVLYFWAPWCTTCSSLDQEIFAKHQAVPDDVTILRIDYDHAAALKQLYNITIQHTFVQVDPDGHEITTWVGGDMDELKTKLR